MKDKKEDGGQAFPRSYAYMNPEAGRSELRSLEGMTIRDLFAAEAMQGLIAGGKTLEPHAEGSDTSCPAVAERAFEYADAMIEARKK